MRKAMPNDLKAIRRFMLAMASEPHATRMAAVEYLRSKFIADEKERTDSPERAP